jgi:hypothetical protein
MSAQLDRLLGGATNTGEDWDWGYTDVLVTIGKGMFWSPELDRAARELAQRVREELALYDHLPK